ncbi:MAG: TIGR00645 family protein [Gammaproteobacteria bacterium]|nr:TIGR00645 family protein [Gammaproteobacteria bacterium]MCW5582822.1 TIGR00645 family protein [Gammaproteobacteria bacterium]
MQSTRQSLANFIFMSRWLQAPLYLGLIVILCVYVYEFGMGLIHLVAHANTLTDTGTILLALDLIDMVMIANLLIMVTLGGYQTFVSHLHLQNNPDHPEWLDEVNAGTMKIKLALALITISSVHLLRTFMDPAQKEFYVVMWQVLIHITLMFSAVLIAVTDRIMSGSYAQTKS